MKTKRINKPIDEAYPVTLIKYMMNKIFIDKFLLSKVKNPIRIEEDRTNCIYCKEEKMCKFHKSTQVVLKQIDENKRNYSLNANVFVIRNELYALHNNGKTLRIVYCPHFTQMKLSVQNFNSRLFNYVTCIEVALSQPRKIENITPHSFLYNISQYNYISCWCMGNMDIYVSLQNDKPKFFLATQ